MCASFGLVDSSSEVQCEGVFGKEVTASSTNSGGRTTLTLTDTNGTGTGDGSTATLTINSGRSVNDVIVSQNGFILVPTDDYTISGTTLTFVTAPVNGA